MFFSTYGADVTKRPEYVHIIDTICKNEELKKKISVIKTAISADSISNTASFPLLHSNTK